MLLNVEDLISWFLDNRRDLPWRRQCSPYAVWVSEVMLQQTQVAVVIPYFLRWMERFPTIESLAESSADDVIKLWEGLGYYSRARRLHEGARYIVQEHGGKIPRDEESLGKVKGLGPYTIGAILSFAFHKKKAAVDGNVIRVLTRYFHIEEDVAKASTLKKLRQIAEDLLPEEESWLVNEGLIELGATVCQKKPNCQTCPLKNGCQSFSRGTMQRLPIKKKAVATTRLYRAVAVLTCQDHCLVTKRQKGEVMEGLHEFPFFETDFAGISDEELMRSIQDRYGLDVAFSRRLSQVPHSFTRYQAFLSPVVFTCKDKISIEGMEWINGEGLNRLAFSSGHRRIFQIFKGNKP
jgi:A/G-specific adenine glycosylase